jgi:hypothetical protein
MFLDNSPLSGDALGTKVIFATQKAASCHPESGFLGGKKPLSGYPQQKASRRGFRAFIALLK